MRYPYTTIRTGTIKRNNDSTISGKGMEKLDLSYVAVGNLKWYSHYGKIVCHTSRNCTPWKCTSQTKKNLFSH